MSITSKSKKLLGSMFALAVSAAPVTAETTPPVVVELFTSQGCYSCPPAEALLGELSSRPDLVALEYHVDYWDDLEYWTAGKWKDPFSSPDHTQRQREYNILIRKTGAVYTPQTIVDGRYEVVGSRRHSVANAINRAVTDVDSKLKVRIDPVGEKLSTRIEGSARGPLDVWLVRYHQAVTTVVKSGENKGKTLTSHHIVKSKERLGTWRRKSFEARFNAAGNNEGCAILVQAGPIGPVLGAATCPGGPSS